MKQGVLRRFVFLMAIMLIVFVVATEFLVPLFDRPPGDYQTDTGALRLEDGLYDEALEHFDRALEEQPNHRGALMGRALVFIQTERYDEAVAELDHLIEYLEANLAEDDATGRGALASAYANRGIVKDRQARYEEALEDYIQALRTDSDTVSGPGIVYKILRPTHGLSTVRERAQYLYEQLQLPEDERVMRIPELDAKNRMYKP